MPQIHVPRVPFHLPRLSSELRQRVYDAACAVGHSGATGAEEWSMAITDSLWCKNDLTSVSGDGLVHQLQTMQDAFQHAPLQESDREHLLTAWSVRFDQARKELRASLANHSVAVASVFPRLAEAKRLAPQLPLTQVLERLATAQQRTPIWAQWSPGRGRARVSEASPFLQALQGCVEGLRHETLPDTLQPLFAPLAQHAPQDQRAFFVTLQTAVETVEWSPTAR